MDVEINKIIDDIKKSIVFQMSLGNKELFHSNLWNWLIQQRTELITVFFPNLRPVDIKQVKREDKNRDIVLKLYSGDEYVIENKLKSYPNKEQLERYSDKKTYPNFKEGIITGIKEPSFDFPVGWKFRSYSQIANGITSFITLFDKYEQDV